MTRPNWTTDTAGRVHRYGIIGRILLFIFSLGCILTVAWAFSPNQPIH